MRRGTSMAQVPHDLYIWYRDRYTPPPPSESAQERSTIAEAIARDFGDGLTWQIDVRLTLKEAERLGVLSSPDEAPGTVLVPLSLIEVLSALGTPGEAWVTARADRWAANCWTFEDGSRLAEPIEGAWEILDRFTVTVDGTVDLGLTTEDATIDAIAAAIEGVVGPAVEDADHASYASEWYAAGFREPLAVVRALKAGITDPTSAASAARHPSPAPPA